MFLPLDRRNTELLMSKNQIPIFFIGVNENSITFLYTFEKGGQENLFRRGKKFSFLPFSKVYKRVEMSTKKNLEFGFIYLVLVYPMDRTCTYKFFFSKNGK